MKTTEMVITAIHVFVVVLMPIVVLMIRSSQARLDKMHEENQARLERIENGLIERISRLEGKIDGHLSWHIVNHKS